MSEQRRQRPRAGFTLTEMFVAMTIATILAGLAVPHLNFERWRADAGARQLRVALQTAQRLAVTQQATVIVGVDSAGRRLRVLEDVNGNLERDGGERVTWRPLDEGLEFSAPPQSVPGVSGGGALVDVGPRAVDGLPSLVFRRDGSASARAALYVASRRRTETEYRGIVVTQSTGRVDWWRARADAAGAMTWKRGNS